MEKSQPALIRDCATPRQVAVASVAAGLLLLVLGAAHRLTWRDPVPPTPFAAGALDGLPMRIGDWTGEDVPLDEALVRGTDTDAHLSRRYMRRGGSESISLYVACGVHVSRLMAHRPEICYRRAGWTPRDAGAGELPTIEGAKLPCDILRFSRDKPEASGVTVLHYWIADGQWYGSVSHLRSRLWAILGAVGYAAHVQIAASTTVFNPEAGARLVAEFAADSAVPITQLFRDIERDRSSGMAGGTPGGN